MPRPNKGRTCFALFRNVVLLWLLFRLTFLRYFLNNVIYNGQSVLNEDGFYSDGVKAVN